jgi:transcriptional regulator of acetoin/glycerol metabolism
MCDDDESTIPGETASPDEQIVHGSDYVMRHSSLPSLGGIATPSAAHPIGVLGFQRDAPRVCWDCLICNQRILVTPGLLEGLGLVHTVAASTCKINLSCESGTGKELLAKLVHAHSSRASGPFVATNCGAISDSLVESAFLGHERGAFTGANKPEPGLFELAHGGTLFLDEIADLSPRAQQVILRVLQEGEVTRVGAGRSRRVDVRIITATHQCLESLVERRQFRGDLLYRLAGVSASARKRASLNSPG